MGKSYTLRVAAEVRAEMARQKISQETLCSRMPDMTQSKLSRRLTGEYPFDVEELAEAAIALGVAVSSFLPAPDRSAA